MRGSEEVKTRIQRVIDHLEGTCGSLAHACETFGFSQDDLTKEELQQVDEHIFECSSCGWWCEISEMSAIDNGENVCNECCESED